MIITFSPNSAPWNLTFPFFPLLAPRLPLGRGLGCCGPQDYGASVLHVCSSWRRQGQRERERAGKVETLQRQMHFIDKATALYRAEADTPGGQGHIGGRGSDSHWDTGWGVPHPPDGSAGWQPWKEGRGLGSRLALSQIQHFLQETRSASEGIGNGVWAQVYSEKSTGPYVLSLGPGLVILLTSYMNLDESCPPLSISFL